MAMFLTHAYLKGTFEKVKAHEKSEQDHARVVQSRLNDMTATQHVALIYDIITSHVGGKGFELNYDLPFDGSNPRHKMVLSEIHNHYYPQEPGILLSMSTTDGSGIRIKFGSMPIPKSLEEMYDNRYSERSYRRFTVEVDKADKETFKIGFVCQDQKHIPDLILFSSFIKMKVFELQVSWKSICVPDRLPRVPDNMDLHIPHMHRTFYLPRVHETINNK